MDAIARTAHRGIPAPRHAHVQRLRSGRRRPVPGHGPAEELLTSAARPAPRLGAPRPARRAPSRSSQLLLHPATRIAAFFLCSLPFIHLAADWLAELGVLSRWHSTLGPEQIHATQLRTGLWTLRFLAITLAVTPARELLELSALARYRRMLGLFVFFYASLHVTTWTWADANFDAAYMLKEVGKHRYILVGMLGFLLLVPLAITSTKGWIRRLGGQRWARLHRLIYPAAIAGTVHYLWGVKKDTLFPFLYLATFAVLLGYRAWVAVAAHQSARTR